MCKNNDIHSLAHICRVLYKNGWPSQVELELIAALQIAQRTEQLWCAIKLRTMKITGILMLIAFLILDITKAQCKP